MFLYSSLPSAVQQMKKIQLCWLIELVSCRFCLLHTDMSTYLTYLGHFCCWSLHLQLTCVTFCGSRLLIINLISTELVGSESIRCPVPVQQRLRDFTSYFCGCAGCWRKCSHGQHTPCIANCQWIDVPLILSTFTRPTHTHTHERITPGKSWSKFETSK